MKLADDEAVQAAFETLQAAIAGRIVAEQQTHQLTKLPNLFALQAWLKSRIEDGRDCCVALVEIDGFKAINQRYTYDDADLLLIEVGASLRRVESNGGWHAFHAHGDEFYCSAEVSASDDVDVRLNQVREAVKALSVPSPATGQNMSCTVSIGWASLFDAPAEGAVVTFRTFVRLAEVANKEAKRTGKDKVVRWTPAIQSLRILDTRIQCSGCEAVLTVVVPASCWQHAAPMACPNCGERLERPYVERRDPPVRP